MNWFAALARRKSASVARERLQILLTHERVAGGHSDLIPLLREEVVAVVARHVAVDPEKVNVRIERGKAVSLLEIDIEIPSASGSTSHAIKRGAAAAGRWLWSPSDSVADLSKGDRVRYQAADASSGSRAAFSSLTLCSLAASVSGTLRTLNSDGCIERPSK